MVLGDYRTMRMILITGEALRLQRLGLVLLVTSLSFLAGCAGGLTQSARQALSVVVPHDVDFEELHYYAVRSESAYDEHAEIRKTYPDVSRVTTLSDVNVRYFIETDDAARTHTVSVRGTASKPNIWQDLETTLINDSILGHPIHGGFQKDARSVWSDAKPHLRQDYSIRVTGHSLGAAVALLVGAYANAEGYTVTRIVNFGQPKVTTDDVEGLLIDTVTRVIDDKDVVPMVPPPGVVQPYRHVGPEVILRPGADFVYLDDHDVDRVTVDDFWRDFSNFSLEEHYMVNYLANIEYKLENGARQIPYLVAGK